MSRPGLRPDRTKLRSDNAAAVAPCLSPARIQIDGRHAPPIQRRRPGSNSGRGADALEKDGSRLYLTRTTGEDADPDERRWPSRQ